MDARKDERLPCGLRRSTVSVSGDTVVFPYRTYDCFADKNYIYILSRRIAENLK